MEKIKILQETRDYKKKYYQRIVEYNGHKFKYSITPTGDTPLAARGFDYDHALKIMKPDGTFQQIEDIVSIGGSYTHSDMAYGKPQEEVERMVEADYKDFDNYIKKIY